MSDFARMMIRSYIRLGSFGRLLFSLATGWLALMETSSQAQMSLNVTNFGARGDAVQFYVNTVSNSVVVTTTNQLTSADIGKSIEVFSAGKVTTPPNCQDMVATITNVIGGTNIYVSQVARATLTNIFATYGHNNQTNFANAIAACGGATNAIINIPAGTFLLMAQTNPLGGNNGNRAISIRGGGLHFVGSGTKTTTLLSQGAWILQAGLTERGFLFQIVLPITNDYPSSIENMTLDGGVQQGNITNKNYPASTVDGMGWDGYHSAIVTLGVFGGSILTHQTWTNLVFQHWRGEIVKSTDLSTNGNLSVLNCVYTDGNASAINYYAATIYSGCIFNNLFMVGEYYQKFSTNASYFQNNLVTNITGNALSFNGASTNRPVPPFNVVSNTFYLFSGANGIGTTPGQNIFITGNKFIGAGTGVGIALGTAGAQGTAVNSNIVVTFNLFTNIYTCISIQGTSPWPVYSVLVLSNTFATAHTVASGYGWSTNVIFFGNTSTKGLAGNANIDSSSLLGQWILDDLSDQFPFLQTTGSANGTNILSYKFGARCSTWSQFNTSSFQLDDSLPIQIPPGAMMVISNLTSSSSEKLYTSSTSPGTYITLTNGQTVIYSWTNGVWANITSPTNAPAVIQVMPPSQGYGTILIGTSKTNSFTVQNVGSGTLSGTASVGAPFSILSGGSYNLGSNQSQTVTMLFSPSGAGNYSQNVTFTGGGGTNAVVSGSATNAPVSPAIRVTPATIVYGTLLSGTSKTNSFTVQNVGTGTLSGTASVGAPFSILSGGSYSLSSNQSQTVTMVFNPVMAGNYSQNVSLSGGGGTNTIVSGNATNVPPVLPTVSAIGANVPDADTNKAGFQVYVGTTVQLSASASAPNGDALTWQWSYSLNGGTQTVYQSGSGTAPTASFTYTDGTAGNTYVWNLQVTDSQTQLSAQSQLTLSVTLKPPLGFRVLSN
jgi:hypothetical protein